MLGSESLHGVAAPRVEDVLDLLGTFEAELRYESVEVLRQFLPHVAAQCILNSGGGFGKKIFTMFRRLYYNNKLL